tara:strand:+ start:1101 stop:1325 length:225 start_codon:yes stop_codon:yes gene_type:complete
MHKTDPNYNETMASKNVHGVVGENALWDGPLDQTGRPHGVGSSSGITGMQVLKAKCHYSPGPITSKSSLYSKKF